MENNSSQTSQISNLSQKIDICLICGKNSITYCPMPCRCPILCKPCAMKMATGGKCRKCKELFSECRRL